MYFWAFFIRVALEFLWGLAILICLLCATVASR